MKTVTLKIMSKDYRIECQDDEEHYLKDAAEKLDKKMREVKNNLGAIGMERIAIMAGLNMSYESITENNKREADKANIQNQLSYLLQKLDKSLI